LGQSLWRVSAYRGQCDYGDYGHQLDRISSFTDSSDEHRNFHWYNSVQLEFSNHVHGAINASLANIITSPVAIQASLNAVIASTAPLANAANWNNGLLLG